MIIKVNTTESPLLEFNLQGKYKYIELQLDTHIPLTVFKAYSRVSKDSKYVQLSTDFSSPSGVLVDVYNNPIGLTDSSSYILFNVEGKKYFKITTASNTSTYVNASYFLTKV